MIMDRMIQSGKIALGILLVSAALTGCKSGEESLGLNPERIDKTRSAIRAEISDMERRTAMLAIVESFDAEAQQFFEEAKAIRQQIVDANRDYDTTREQLQQLYDALGDQLGRLGQTTKGHSLKLRILCSEAEWNEIFDHDADAVEFNF